MSRTATETRKLDYPVDKVWEYMEDVRKIQLHNPYVKNVNVISANPNQCTGVGAGRKCHFHDGNSIEEIVIESIPKSKIVLEAPTPPFPIKELNIVFQLQPETTNARTTLISMSMVYTVKYGPMGRMMDYCMISPKLHDVMWNILAGLEHHLKTGQVVEPITNLKVYK